MAKKKEQTPRDGVWFWELNRFGYYLKVFGRTKEEVFNAMSEEYIKTYAQWNSLNENALRSALISPILDEDGEIDEYAPENEFREFYSSVFVEFNDSEPQYYEFGKVVWE